MSKIKPGFFLFSLILALTTCLSVSSTTAQVASGGRAEYNFNADWKLYVGDAKDAQSPAFDDAAWQSVTLPHAWNEDDAFRKDIRDLSTGIAWYRKTFGLPSGAQGKKVFLEFEGIRQAGEFYLNGKFIGRHENGVSAFGFDVTDFLNPASWENILAVRIDNTWDYREKATNTQFQWSDRNFNANYGGINKNVRLHITDKLYQTLPLYTNLGTTGVYIYADEFDIKNRRARINAGSEIRNETPTTKTFIYEVALIDMDGKTVKTFGGENFTLATGETKVVRADAVVDKLNFWSWGYGYLYRVRTSLKVDGKLLDTVETRTGFRKTEFANGMFRLNDRVLQLKGYAQRTTNEWPAIGNSVPAWVSDFSNRLMVESNANLVRWMHVTPWKQDVESCDRVGLIEAMPAGDSEKDIDGRRWQQRVEAMRDGIIYNRNNPSVIFYESGNENISETHMGEMRGLRDRFDPHGGRAAGSREMLDSTVAEYGGEMLYINKSARLPFWAMEYSRDEALRKYWDEYSPPFHKDGAGPLHNGQDASAYNRNQDSHAIENVVRWFDYWEARPGTGKRISSGGVNIIFSDSNTHHRGAENYRRSGEVDAVRLPKDGYFAHQVMWDGWVETERPRLHIVGHWNYVPDTKKNVYVISSAEKVELFLNGKSLGYGAQSSRFLFTFKDVQWQPGKLQAIGYDARGKSLITDEKQTAGAPAKIKLTLHTRPGGMRADGADLALADVEVVDDKGRRCPTLLNEIKFDLTGAAEWRGGIAQGQDNYILSKTLPVENGVNRVLLRSLREAGAIKLTATAEGLAPATLEFSSQPVMVVDGLSIGFPADGLPSYLARGATPLTPSFKTSRTPVAIASVTAGANADKAAASFDDNEMTAWTNDGKPETAWIEYAFAHPATVNQVVLKLTGWRTLSYPLKITLDGREIFAGVSPRSLGYVTFTIPPTRGQRLKIELTGDAGNRDAFGNIIEITGQPDPTSLAGRSAGRRTLSIVETEIYQAAN